MAAHRDWKRAFAVFRRDDQSLADARTKPARRCGSHAAGGLADGQAHIARTSVVRPFRAAQGVERPIDERSGIDRTKAGLDDRQEIGAEVGE
jgi:hypothetical protein